MSAITTAHHVVYVAQLLLQVDAPLSELPSPLHCRTAVWSCCSPTVACGRVLHDDVLRGPRVIRIAPRFRPGHAIAGLRRLSVGMGSA